MTDYHFQQYSPETAAMVEFAICQKPLHEVDVFATGGARAAERAAFGRWARVTTRLQGLAWLLNVTTGWFLREGTGGWRRDGD